MGNCDLCNTMIEGNAKRYSADQIKAAAKVGLRPPRETMLLGAALGLSLEDGIRAWLQTVMADTTDWALCSSCSKQTDKFLEQARKKWWQFWK